MVTHQNSNIQYKGWNMLEKAILLQVLLPQAPCYNIIEAVKDRNIYPRSIEAALILLIIVSTEI